MTPERAKYMWPIIKAFSEGRDVRWKDKRTGEWNEPYDPDFEVNVEWTIVDEAAA